jgi:hypothetical protein
VVPGRVERVGVLTLMCGWISPVTRRALVALAEPFGDLRTEALAGFGVARFVAGQVIVEGPRSLISSPSLGTSTAARSPLAASRHQTGAQGLGLASGHTLSCGAASRCCFRLAQIRCSWRMPSQVITRPSSRKAPLGRTWPDHRIRVPAAAGSNVST